MSTNKSVAIAIVFGGGDDDGNSYEYVIRPNATNFNSEEKQAQPAAKTTPSTERVFDPYKREWQLLLEQWWFTWSRVLHKAVHAKWR